MGISFFIINQSRRWRAIHKLHIFFTTREATSICPRASLPRNRRAIPSS
jgi:hypothetical protein